MRLVHVLASLEVAVNAISSGYLKGLSNGFLDRASLITELGVCQPSCMEIVECQLADGPFQK